MHSFSFGEIALIFGIVVILFGGSRLASIGKSLGEGIANFKKGLNANSNDTEEQQKELPNTKATAYQPPRVTSSQASPEDTHHVKSKEYIDVEQK